MMKPGLPAYGDNKCTSWDQIRHLKASDHKIRAHIFKGYLAEVFESKKQIQTKLQTRVETFCYPHKAHDQGIIDDVLMLYDGSVSPIAGQVQATSGLQTLTTTRVN